jgi:hypothetical protein
MIDTTKHYILQNDGHIYYNTTVVTEGSSTTTYPNLLVKSTATLNARMSGSSGAVTEGSTNCHFVTDYIDVSAKSASTSNLLVRIGMGSVTSYKINLNWELTSHADHKVVFFDKNKAHIGRNVLSSSSNYSVSNGKTVIDLKKIHSSSSSAPSDWGNVAYIRLELSNGTTTVTQSTIENCQITCDSIYETVTIEGSSKQEWVDSGLTYTPTVTYKTDLIGVLGENNVIYLSDNALPSGTYTLKYSDETYDTIGTITIE